MTEPCTGVNIKIDQRNDEYRAQASCECGWQYRIAINGSDRGVEMVNIAARAHLTGEDVDLFPDTGEHYARIQRIKGVGSTAVSSIHGLDYDCRRLI